MKNRFLWILCALLSLLVLTGGCNRKPASTADVPRSLSHQYKIAVAPFTQPRDISQLIMGQLPQPQALAARDVLIAQDRQLRDVLYTTTKRSYDFLPRTRPLPDLKRFHTSERPQALAHACLCPTCGFRNIPRTLLPRAFARVAPSAGETGAQTSCASFQFMFM